MHQAITYKHIVLGWSEIKRIKLEPQHFNQLLILIYLYDKKEAMVSTRSILDECCKFSYINSFKENLFGLKMLLERKLILTRSYIIKSTGATRIKYMPSVSGRLLASDFWAHFETESTRLLNEKTKPTKKNKAIKLQ